jgi:hypothetical protein
MSVSVTPDSPTPGDLRGRVQRTAVRLLLWLVAIALLALPLARGLDLGETTRAGILTFLLLCVALYWLFTDMGYRPLLLFQLVFFSTALVFLSAKALLVGIGVHSLSILRRTAIYLDLLGAACAGVNVILLLVDLFRAKSPRPPAPTGQVDQ